MRSSIAKAHNVAVNVVRSMPRDILRPSLQLPVTLDVLVNRALNHPIAHSEKSEPLTTSGSPQDPKPAQAANSVDITITRAIKALSEMGGDVAFRQAGFLFNYEQSLPSLPLLILYNAQCGCLPLQYPLSSRLLSPPADPLYYTRLAQGVHRAEQGKARAWWKIFFQSKGQA